uniref:Somatostatin/Cortistatin C-terminal domain-containing protein n=1 Tax=Stegastes partitus TaxID=144197 RepID=A0A3B5AJI2_9TELE
MARVLCIWVFLCFASCVSANTNTEEGFGKLQSQQDPLSWLDDLQDGQATTKKQNLLDLFYKLFRSENEIILREPEETQKNRRGVGSGSRAATRRPGCLVFFWKSWANC